MHRLLAPMVALLFLVGCGAQATPALDGAVTSGPPTAASGTPVSPRSAAATEPAPASPRPTATAAASPSASAALDVLRWRPCEEGNECAELELPLDYEDPGGPTITIALLRMPATDPANRIGSLLYNPGGPGASGVDTVAQAGQFLFSPTARARFDIVGFDPRGVGRSDAVRCLPSRPVLEEPYPDDAAEVEKWTAAARAVAEACEAQNGDVLPHLGTENVARDLDRIRAALGDQGLTYLGQSYGTLIGALYADLFPDRVRAMVLDAPVDPDLSGAELIAGQAEGFEAAIDRFLAACAADASCQFGAGGDPAGSFRNLTAQWDAGPVAGVSGNVAWNGVAIALLSGAWDQLADALARAEQGDLSGLADLAGPAIDPEALDAYDAVACLDLSVGNDPVAYGRLGQQLERSAPGIGPFLAWSPGWGSVDCAFWPVPPQRDPEPVDPEGVAPILVIGGTHDPATPYPWAEALAEQLPSSVLLTRDGDGHGSYGRSDCINRHTDDYLVGLSLPPAGTVCR